MSSVYLNPSALQWQYNSPAPRPTSNPTSTPPSSRLFLQSLLPDYAPTPLHSLPSLAQSLQLGHLLLKDESHRFGLPSFKILGASWAVYRAVADALHLSPDDDHPPSQNLEIILQTARAARGIKIVTCTAGNWGRAVARMGKWLDVPAVVYVSRVMTEETRGLIRGEGAEVVVVEGDYGDAVAAARGRATEGGGHGDGEEEKCLLVMDIGWEGYEKVPEWVVEGYQTMLEEIDSQAPGIAGGKQVTHVIVPVGCGSIAQAVTQHFKGLERVHGNTRVITVEPTTAACLKESLERQEMTRVETGDTIMCGMNCGILSTPAWPVLRKGVDVSVIVSDIESNKAVQELGVLGIQAGPCGAAPLAALRQLCEEPREKSKLHEDSVVVLCCTEGARKFDMPA